MSANLTAEDVESLQEGYRLFREHDPAFMELFAPEARFVFPTTLPAGGTFAGPWEALEFTTTVSERVDDPRPRARGVHSRRRARRGAGHPACGGPDQRTPCHRPLCPRLQLQRGGPARGAEGHLLGADLRHREFRRRAGRG